MKPIETLYNGYRFRSRLEARWAVFFDALGVEYEYEPEGFKLDNGMFYLPDFRVKCWGKRGSIWDEPFDLWIEVKGNSTLADAEKIESFYCCGDNSILVVSDIPNYTTSSDCYYNSSNMKCYEPMHGSGLYPFNYMYIDGDYFGAYPAAHDGKFYLWGDEGSYIRDEDIPTVATAYSIARRARFEHGEKGYWS